ncbi:MAG: Arm DNA-binding domain-containing protein [Flavisolibacter sp.]
MESLEIRFNYFLRTSYKSADDKHPIALRVTYRGERRDIFTGIYCHQKNWDKTVQRASETESRYSQINRTISGSVKLIRSKIKVTMGMVGEIAWTGIY